jgi:DNA modification methylase
MFIDHLVEIFMECKRVMKPTGSLWVNIADSYRGSGNGIGGNEDEGKQVYLLKNKANIKSNLKGYNKSLLGIPERLCIALTDKGLLRRSTIIWHKRNCLPSSATDRFTNDFEYFYFFTKSPKYYFKQQFEPLKTESKKRAMRGSSGKGKYANGEQFPEGVHAMTMLQEREHIGYNDMEEKIASGQTLLNPMGRNKRTVWTLTNKSYRKAHFAVFQEALITTPIDACCPEKICVKCGKAINIRINTKSIATRPNKTTKDINGEFATDRQRFMPVLIGEELEVCNCNAGFKPGIVLDPFFGSGTSGKVAIEQGKDFIGLELNPEYIKLAEDRIKAVQIKMF